MPFDVMPREPDGAGDEARLAELLEKATVSDFGLLTAAERDELDCLAKLADLGLEDCRGNRLGVPLPDHDEELKR